MSEATSTAYEAIRAKILSGEIPAGSRLKEADLAQSIGVSRTPVREALRRLKVEGLIDAPFNLGARVVSWSPEDLAEITDLRAMLESYGAGLAAQKITDVVIMKLQEHTDEMERCLNEAPKDLPEQIALYNNEFHRLIIDTTGNRRLAAAIHILTDSPLILRKFSVLDTDQIRRSIAHHREIIEAFRKRDADWARSMMRTHILAGRTADRVIEMNTSNELADAQIGGAKEGPK